MPEIPTPRRTWKGYRALLAEYHMDGTQEADLTTTTMTACRMMDSERNRKIRNSHKSPEFGTQDRCRQRRSCFLRLNFG